MAIVSVEVTGFQCASTAFTVTVKGEPEVMPLGEPVLPDALPGAAVSPGTSSWSFVNPPASTVVAGLVSPLFTPSVWSVALTVHDPALFSERLKVVVPATSAFGAGGVEFVSLVLIATVSADETAFQLASTALTVTLKVPPAVWPDGTPVLPDAVPGAAVSPGRRTWSFANAPGSTVVHGLVSAVIEPLVTSVAVMRTASAVFEVTANVWVPATSAAFAGSVAFASVEVIATVSVEVTGFQLASTALTVTLKLDPAVSLDGDPVLPEALPGEAVSPGIRICSFAKDPALIVVEEPVFAVFEPSSASVAVNVFDPAVFAVTEKVFVPAR